VNFVLAIPWEVRLALLFVLGTAAGSLMNLAIYRLAWRARSISPWSAPLPLAPPRKWSDRIPVFGWLGLRRESRLHGGAVWVRPMIVELGSGALFAAIYWWEVARRGLLPDLAIPAFPPVGPMATPNVELALHAQALVHLVLLSLMIVASLIDADEMIIPDTVTLPGTLIGLIAAGVYPWSLLPDKLLRLPPRVPWVEFLSLASPDTWPAALNAKPHGETLGLALGCWWLWCFALMPRRWHGRYGWARAMQLFLARLTREAVTWRLVGLGLAGSLGIAAVWWRGNDASWAALLTSLVGLAVGGGLVWMVRIIGAAVLRREAMGFGDVTLMAMIGAFLGWQACLLIFFLAPFAGLVIGGLKWVFHGEREIPYGPFLRPRPLGHALGAGSRHVRHRLARAGRAGLVPRPPGGAAGTMALDLGPVRLMRCRPQKK
jgi:prepilin signal peptidase PulO-like enzyme (type II secretory pathway)